jgi:hypothetical protein
MIETFNFHQYNDHAMKKIVFLGTMLSAVLVAALMVPAIAHLPYQGIVAGSDSVTAVNPNLTKLSLTATGTVPRQTPDLVGFAWFYSSGPNTAYAITSHQSVRDSNQNPDGWHAHNVVLGAPPAGYPADGPSADGVVADVCVAAVSDAPTSGIGINQSTITVNARTSTLTGTFPSPPVSAAFDIVVDADCPPTAPSGLTLGLVVDAIDP